MDSKNFAIGVLSTTAVILFVGLLVINTRPEPAYASNMNARGGDYLLTTGQLSDTEELLYLIDASNQVLVVYRFDLNQQKVKITQRKDLSKLVGAAKEETTEDPSSKSKSRRGRSRRR